MRKFLSILALSACVAVTFTLAVGLIVQRQADCSDGSCKPFDLPAGVPRK